MWIMLIDLTALALVAHMNIYRYLMYSVLGTNLKEVGVTELFTVRKSSKNTPAWPLLPGHSVEDIVRLHVSARQVMEAKSHM